MRVKSTGPGSDEFVAVASFAHEFGAVAEGDHFPASDPLLATLSPYFLPASEATPSAMAARRAELHPTAPPAPLPPPVADDGAMVCIAPCEGAAVGAVLDRRSRPVRDHPGRFVPRSRGVARERAMVALVPFKTCGRDGALTLDVRPGQWVDRDDALVSQYPMHFASVETAE